MSRAYPQAPGFGVGAVVFKDGGVLLARRGQPPAAGSWILPGGLVELGERIEDAVVREVKEETGWIVRVVQFVQLFDLIDRDETGRIRYHYILADYLCRYVGGTLAADSDVTDVKLVPLTQLSEYKLTPKAMEVIEAARCAFNERGLQ